MQRKDGNKRYVVSKLQGRTQVPVTREEYMPKVMLRSKADDVRADIFIPSVSLAQDSQSHMDSPRSVGSAQSSITFASQTSIGNDNRVYSPRPSLNHPLKYGDDGAKMILEVETNDNKARLESPIRSLKEMETTLPKDMRGTRRKIVFEEQVMLRQSLNLKPQPALPDGRSNKPITDDEDSVHSSSSTAQHDPSGNSVSLFNKRNSRGVRNLWGGYPSHGLWGDDVEDSNMTIEERENAVLGVVGPNPNSSANPSRGAHSDKNSAPSSGTQIQVTRDLTDYERTTTGQSERRSEFEGDDENSIQSGHGLAILNTYRTMEFQEKGVIGIGATSIATDEYAVEEKSSTPNHPIHGDLIMSPLATPKMTIGKKEMVKVKPPPSIDIDLTSKARGKLLDLGKFVHGHTHRKVVSSWISIESRFLKSKHVKVEMVKDTNGVSYPVKNQAMYLSALTGTLCSSGVRCTYQELKNLYGDFNINDAEIMRSRRLAALRIVLGNNNGEGLIQQEELVDELSSLMVDEEPLISKDQLFDAVFPKDPKEREQELADVEKKKPDFIKQMVEEKEKKEEMVLRVQSRKLKMVSDFDNTVRDVQFPKGVLAIHKLKQIKDLIEYCEKAYEDAHAATDVKVSDELVALLGLEAFPKCVRDGIEETQSRMRQENNAFKTKLSQGGGKGKNNNSSKEDNKSNSPPKEELEVKKTKKEKKEETIKKFKTDEENSKNNRNFGRIGYEGQFRILLHKPKIEGHTVLSLIREVVSYGKGLIGLAYRDVVEILQAYSATRLQSRFRTHKKWWRYKIARSKWTMIFTASKVKHFVAWSRFIRHVYDTRNFCWRKLISWKTYTRNAKNRREKFRINFWPFYVWHRYASASRTAKEKAKFLVHRVEPTLRCLRVFKGWKKYYKEEKYLRDTADDFNAMVLNYRGRINLTWWRRWTRRRIKIRHNWYKYGIVSYRRKIFMNKVTPFLIWKMFWYYKKLLHYRLIAYAPIFRLEFMQEAPIIRQPTCGEIKAKAREIYNEEQKEEEDKLKKEKKSKKKSRKKAKAGADEESESDASVSTTASAKPPPKKSKFASSEGATVSSKLMKPFLFKPSPTYQGGDVDSDFEDLYTPSRMQTVYREKVDEMLSPAELDFLGDADDFIFNKIMILSRKFAVIDNWNLVEWSMRYHKLIHRAFRNLRVFSKVSRNARKSSQVHAKKVKRRCFMALLSWMLRDPAAISLSEQTEAEKAYADAKNYRMDKMMKWRDIGADIKENLDRDDEDNLLDDDNGPTEKEKRIRKTRRLEKAAKAKADLEAGIEPFKPPNFLEWDRKEREEEFRAAEEMLVISKKVRARAFDLSGKADIASAMFDADESSLNVTVDKVFKEEEEESQVAIKNELEYIDKFKIHAADNLLTVLARIYREVQVLLMKAETKRYFRALRMPMIKKRSNAMFNRKRMVNWIRICRRLGGLYDRAPVYYKRRKVWVVFNRWLKLVEKESLNVTPGLVQTLVRTLDLFKPFHFYLKENGFQKTVYPSSKKLYNACSTLSGIFKRWCMCVAEDKMFRLMEEKANTLYSLKLLQKTFWSLKTLMTPEETYSFRLDYFPFTLTRAKADLDQYTKRFIAARHKNLLINIADYNRRYTFYSMREAKRAPRFKTFIEGYKIWVNRRLIREQRILVDSFENRGTQEFVDVCCPDLSDPIVPAMMSRLAGMKTFMDPHPKNEDLYSPLLPNLPGGFRMSKVRINHQGVNGNVEESVTGWQVVWGADMCSDIEGPKRGKWKGAAMTVHEFVVPKDDFVMGIEYLYEGSATLGVRIKTFFGGFSRWLGGKPALSSLSVYLGCDLAPEQPFEKDYTVPGWDEQKNPALPRTYVIGFTGLEVDRKASGMGLIVRKIKDQHVFSYNWVADAIQKKKVGNFGAPSEMRITGKESADEVSVGVESFPSNVDADRYAFQHGGVSVSESLTQASALPPIAGASKIEENNNKDANLDDASSLGNDRSVTFADGGAPGEGGEVDNKSMGDSLVQLEAGVPVLLSSEEQFFDVFRMRAMEVSTAESRAESFARRLWTARHMRKDPVLSKLTGINIIAPLTRWYYQSICRRLVRATATEQEGEDLLDDARDKRLVVDSLTRRSVAEFIKKDTFSNEPQPWQDKKALSPKERALKRQFMDQIRIMTRLAEDSRDKARDLLKELLRNEKLGKMLLPRMQLSEFICQNFRQKIAAARHKETLLERMDMEAIKKALSGGDAKVSELSDVSMEIIRSSLAGNKKADDEGMTINKVIAQEMAKFKAESANANANTNNSRKVVMPGYPGTGRALSPTSRKTFNLSHAEYNAGIGSSFRKNIAINPLNRLSALPASVTMSTNVKRTLPTSGAERVYSQNRKEKIKKLTAQLSKSTSNLYGSSLSKEIEGDSFVDNLLRSKDFV